VRTLVTITAISLLLGILGVAWGVRTWHRADVRVQALQVERDCLLLDVRRLSALLPLPHQAQVPRRSNFSCQNLQ
jgi:hypothetical protein